MQVIEDDNPASISSNASKSSWTTIAIWTVSILSVVGIICLIIVATQPGKKQDAKSTATPRNITVREDRKPSSKPSDTNGVDAAKPRPPPTVSPDQGKPPKQSKKHPETPAKKVSILGRLKRGCKSLLSLPKKYLIPLSVVVCGVIGYNLGLFSFNSADTSPPKQVQDPQPPASLLTSVASYLPTYTTLKQFVPPVLLGYWVWTRWPSNSATMTSAERAFDPNDIPESERVYELNTVDSDKPFGDVLSPPNLPVPVGKLAFLHEMARPVEHPGSTVVFPDHQDTAPKRIHHYFNSKFGDPRFNDVVYFFKRYADGSHIPATRFADILMEPAKVIDYDEKTQTTTLVRCSSVKPNDAGPGITFSTMTTSALRDVWHDIPPEKWAQQSVVYLFRDNEFEKADILRVLRSGHGLHVLLNKLKDHDKDCLFLLDIDGEQEWHASYNFTGCPEGYSLFHTPEFQRAKDADNLQGKSCLVSNQCATLTGRSATNISGYELLEAMTSDGDTLLLMRGDYAVQKCYKAPDWSSCVIWKNCPAKPTAEEFGNAYRGLKQGYIACHQPKQNRIAIQPKSAESEVTLEPQGDVWRVLQFKNPGFELLIHKNGELHRTRMTDGYQRIGTEDYIYMCETHDDIPELMWFTPRDWIQTEDFDLSKLILPQLPKYKRLTVNNGPTRPFRGEAAYLWSNDANQDPYGTFTGVIIDNAVSGKDHGMYCQVQLADGSMKFHLYEHWNGVALDRLPDAVGDSTCNICQANETRPFQVLRCGHGFHTHCVDGILTDSTDAPKVCPTCRDDISYLRVPVAAPPGCEVPDA